MKPKIETVAGRDALRPRREPYWVMRVTGKFLGFRKMTADSIGTWSARYGKPDGGRIEHSLGTLSEFPAHERFTKACQAADVWFEHVGVGGLSTSYTVKKACENFVAHIRHKRGDTAANELVARYRRLVDSDPIGEVELLKLDTYDVTNWRHRIANKPLIRGGKPTDAKRSKDTLNRELATLRAALNFAKIQGLVSNDRPWRNSLLAFKNAARRRNLYLDKEQRKSLVGNAPPEIRPFLYALACLPLRPGALAKLRVCDFDPKLGKITVGTDKTGGERCIQLPPPLVQIINDIIKDKILPHLPLFARANGSPWNKDAWKYPVKAAVEAAALPNEATAYTLRHSVITDLVVQKVDLLTVAQISGTSVAMIEKHYGHLRDEVVSNALAKLVL